MSAKEHLSKNLLQSLSLLKLFGQLKMQLQKQRLLQHYSLLPKTYHSVGAENVAACYQQQFPDSSIAKNVSIGTTKMSYLVSYGLRPYFNEMTIKDIVQGNSYFTLHFDETITAQVKKQMDLLVHY